MGAQHHMLSRITDLLERGNMPESSDFDLNTGAGALRPARSGLRPAAVLLPLLDRGGELRLILTKRASHLKHHPGQIALPGGKLEETDKDPPAAALREAQEEIGLLPDNVELLGILPFHQTVTGFRITPVIGRVREAFTPVPEAGEVAEVFEVPFAHVADPGRFRIEGRYWGGVKRYYYTIPYGPYYIWGATARILRALAEELDR